MNVRIVFQPFPIRATLHNESNSGIKKVFFVLLKQFILISHETFPQKQLWQLLSSFFTSRWEINCVGNNIKAAIKQSYSPWKNWSLFVFFSLYKK